MGASKEIGSLLIRLADPDASSFNDTELDELAIERLVALAARHGVLSIVARKLADRAPAAVNTGVRLEIGQAMLLESKSKAVLRKLREAGVVCAIVKGPVFSRLLYDHRADRPFTDIDLLVDQADLEMACHVMNSNNFDGRRNKTYDNSHRNMEYKWTLAGNRSVLFELHGNLVHYPLLRRRISFGYDELVAAGEGNTESPEALLCVAIVHAACGHKFHRLKMLVDVLQAARRLPNERFPGFLRLVQEMGFDLEAAVSLSVAGRIFADHRVAKLADQIGANGFTRIGRRLISPDAVIQATNPRNHGSWARRKMFRLVQYLK